MSEIILTEEQAKVIAAGRDGLVKLVGPDGEELGVYDRRDGAMLLGPKDYFPEPSEPGIPAAVVSAGLGALQGEWDRTGGFGRAYCRGFMAGHRTPR